MDKNKIIQGDCLEVMRGWPDGQIDCCVTSPPYWGLRDYGVEGQLGLEKTSEEYVAKMVEIFAEVKRVLKPEGTLWLNLGDSYYSDFGGGSGTCTTGNKEALQIKGRDRKLPHPTLKRKDLCGMPWRVAMALQQPDWKCRARSGCNAINHQSKWSYYKGSNFVEYRCPQCGRMSNKKPIVIDGWYLRQDIIWHKPNPMPESVRDRCTKAHEYIFLLSKQPRYYYDAEAIKEKTGREGGPPRQFGASEPKGTMRQDVGETFVDTGDRNKRSVWTVTTKPYSEAHFATFPPDLILPCILAGCPKDGIVLDPFMGSGTTAVVSAQNGRNYVGCELNQEYIDLGRAEAVETGVPVSEQKKGQMPLFG